MVDNLKYKLVKVRKPHSCWGCTEQFPVGSQMYYIADIDAGKIVDAYWCVSCEQVLHQLSFWEKEQGFGFGDLKKNYQEYYLNEL